MNLFRAVSMISRSCNSLWTCFRTVNLEIPLTRFHLLQSYSKKAKVVQSRSRKSDPKPVIEGGGGDNNSFFIVRKGDIVGVYKNLSDCQAQVGSSICNPPATIYKGYSMAKNIEDHLLSRGLKNALFSLTAADLNVELFGTLTLCPSQPPWLVKSCIIEFDGASKGNPGPAGAGVVIRSCDGNIICKLRAGLGVKTTHVAEYQAMILGLRCAVEKGFTGVRVFGDSKIVCMQIQGLWRVKKQNMSILYQEANSLKKKFNWFNITHVLRSMNPEADAQADLGVRLAEGQVQEEIQ